MRVVAGGSGGAACSGGGVSAASTPRECESLAEESLDVTASAPSLNASNGKKNPWSRDEDERLRAAMVSPAAPLRWKSVAEIVGSRNAKQCRESPRGARRTAIEDSRWGLSETGVEAQE